jgi:hypothetical protein
MAWITPKTDWYGYTDANGEYFGDRFNATDFNRIKNNLNHLRGMAIKLYKEFNIVSLGGDKTPRDYIYADEMNQIEENLNIINKRTLKLNYGTPSIYTNNGRTMTHADLNRIERATLDIYNRLINAAEGRRMLTWNFGMRGGEL